MRIYRTLSEAANETARELFSRGITRYDLTRQARPYGEPARELIAYSYTVTDPNDYDQFFETVREIVGNPCIRRDVAEAWFNAMISDKCANPQPHWFLCDKLQEYYWHFVHDREYNGESYTYCNRISWQVTNLVRLLKQNPERRAAIIAVWRPTDIVEVGEHRVPCSMFYQFIAQRTVDGERLDIIYVQRSCDFVWFYAFDVYRACRLLDIVVERLKKEMPEIRWIKGHFIHFIGSLHAFESEIPERWKW